MTDIEIMPVARFNGNGMTTPRAEPALVDVSIEEDARREFLLADPDTFADWLYGQCHGAKLQTLPRIMRGIVPDMEDRTTPQIVALLLYPRSDIQAAAMDELKARYLRHFGVQP
jgi:hypothetical protein